MTREPGLAHILEGLAELNENRLAAPFGPIRETVSEEMITKIKAVQDIGINMINARGDRVPFHVPTKLAYGLSKCWRRPRK